MKKVLVILGSRSDEAICKPALDLLTEFGVEYNYHISSAHRNPVQTAELAQGAVAAGIGVIIAAAGMAAHLPGVIAAHTPLPVIGLPIASGSLNGVDSLYSIVQMPSGVPVACVGINNAKNAALLAIQILATASPELAARFAQYKADLASPR